MNDQQQQHNAFNYDRYAYTPVMLLGIDRDGSRTLDAKEVHDMLSDYADWFMENCGDRSQP